MTKRKINELDKLFKHKYSCKEYLPPPIKLCRWFSTKHEEHIYEHLINNNMNLNSTWLLVKYKESINCSFFQNKNNFIDLSITIKQKNILKNIFKIVKIFKKIRYKLLIKKICKYLKIHNFGSKYILKYVC